MKTSPEDPLVLLEQASEQAATVLQQTTDPGARASRLADLLRTLAPPALACFCRLTEAGQVRLHALTHDGQTLAVAGTGDNTQTIPQAPAGCQWILQELISPARGALGLAFPADAMPEAEDSLRRLLAAFARELALRLEVEASTRTQATLEAALDEQSWMASLGALASPITHEFNNFLNVILLQVAVLEQDLPAKRRSEFTVIRQQGKSVADLIRQWQQYRARQQLPLQAVDLNQVVHQVAEGLARERRGFGEAPIRLASAMAAGQPEAAEVGITLRLDLARELPPIAGTLLDVRRLVYFLLVNAAAAITAEHGLVTVRTETADGKILLRVEDNGPSLSSPRLADFFEPLARVREGPNGLELATCKTLAHRRLHGSIRAEDRPEGGVAVVATLRPWGEAAACGLAAQHG